MTIRDDAPPVPEGMVLLADYGTYDRALDAERVIVKSAPGAIHGTPLVVMRRETRGYVPAGSCARWQEAQWSVTWKDTYHNTVHGQNFRITKEAEALAYFAKITDPQEVSKIRDYAARQDTMRQEAAEKAAKVTVETAKNPYYRSAWQWRAPELPGMTEYMGHEKTKTAALAKARVRLAEHFWREAASSLPVE